MFFTWRTASPCRKSKTERVERSSMEALKDFLTTFVSFFKKNNIGLALAFLLLFRLAESQLVKMSAPLHAGYTGSGGTRVSPLGQYGLTHGTIGLLFLSRSGGSSAAWSCQSTG
ncbi:MAG: hypothetical protein U5N26_03235 [Candidatus Marinimicrobia bacterium]|nr:hypothetical protein [Candidatus Neomarinimicrobiota bacterium]